MRIGYQGVPGSYSEASLSDYVEKNIEKQTLTEAVSYSNFKDLVDDLIADELDSVVVPVENSTTGIIARVMDLLRYQPLIAIAEIYQPVKHALWGVKGSTIESVREVYSHPEALSQCEKLFVDHPHFSSNAYEDTAKAAAYIKEMNQADKAAIASLRAGELYGLEPLAVNIQNEESNMTRFYVMERHKEVTYQGDKISFYVETRHVSGALSKIMQVFDVFQCNMVSLNARPIENQPFTYGFFLEVDTANMKVPVESLIKSLEINSHYLQVLGNFKAANPVEM